MVQFTAGGNFDEFGQIKINLVVKGPKWLWVFVFRATELSIEYVYCGLRAGPVTSLHHRVLPRGLQLLDLSIEYDDCGLRTGPVTVIIFEFLISSIEDLNVVSAGEQPQESRLVFKTF